MGPALQTLTPLLAPKSVAIVGASSKPGKLGNLALKNLEACGFRGAIYPVNTDAAKSAETYYESISHIEGDVDCAMLLLPAQKIVDAVRECAAKGVKSIVIGAAGFSETGSQDGISAQAEIAAIGRSSGLRVLGPNTNGLICADANLSLGFNAEHAFGGVGGPVSIVSHSGALLGGVAASLRTLGSGFNRFVAVGNEVDVSMLDVVEYAIEDAATSVIGLIVESIRDCDRFEALAQRAAQRSKRIVALKVGRSSAGARAALAHSSRLAGSARAYEALFRCCGVAVVKSVETLAGACAILATTAVEPPGREFDCRLICVSTSGGGGALLADFSEEFSLPLAFAAGEVERGELAEDLKSIPSSALISHPLDVGVLKANWSRVGDFLEVVERHDRTGPVVAYVHAGPTRDRDLDLLRVLAARKVRTGAPVLAVAPGGLVDEVEQHYRDSGVPLFSAFSVCFESLAAALYLVQRPAPTMLVRPDHAHRFDAERLLQLQTSGAALSELESAAILSQAGIPVVRSRTVATAAEVEAAFEAMGAPVVLKALPPGVAHKNDLGMVVLNCRTKPDALDAFHRLGERLAALGYAADVPRLMQPMLSGELEIMAGVSYEADMGHFLVLGLGGIHAEILDEVMLFPMSASSQTMRDLLSRSRLGRLVNQCRNNISALDELIGILDRLRNVIWNDADAIESIDLNPVLITKNGCIAVDALVCPRRPGQPIEEINAR